MTAPAADTRPEKRRLVADLDRSLYLAVKVKTAELDLDLKDFVASALTYYLSTGGWEQARNSVPAPQLVTSPRAHASAQRPRK
jgi:hypothetical protein